MTTTRRSIAAAVAALLTIARPLAAQSLAPQCRAGSTQLEDACQKATDIFQYLVPQLGGALAGGSAFPGAADDRVGARRLAVATRLNGVSGALPVLDLTMPEAGAAQATDYALQRLPLPAPALDVAIGLGEHRVAGVRLPGVDLLLNGAWIPAIARTTVQVAPTKGALHVGFGARVALVEEGARRPGLSFSWQQRGIPSLDVAATALASDDTLAVKSFALRSRAWRLTAQRTGDRGALWVSAGGDQYDASGRLAPVVNENGQRYPDAGAPGDGYLLLLSARARRASASAGAALRVGAVALTGEAGITSGGELATFNTFGGTRSSDARTFVSLGVRIH